MAKSSSKRSRPAQPWMLDGGIWRKTAEIRELHSSVVVEVVRNDMKWVAALLAAFAFAAPPGASGCGPATVFRAWLGPPLLSVVVVFVHCPVCCDAAAMSNPVFAATWDWGLFGLYVLVVLRFEHERSVTELVMIIDGELAVSECWLTAVETDSLLFSKDVTRHSSSSKRFCETFCETLSQFPVCLENSHSSCISDIDSAEITLDSGTWNVSESVEAEVVFALPGWFSRFAVGRACRAGSWNEAEPDFEGVQDVFQACSDSSSAAAATKSVGSDSKVSESDSGEIKENEEQTRVQFFVKHGSTTSVVRSSSRDVVSDILQLHSDEYAVCGSRLIKMDSTLSQNGIGNGSNVQVLRRLRGGAGAYLDIPGQWECKVCHATRCWPARKRCYRCDAPRDTAPSSIPMGPLGRAPPQSRSSGPPTRSSVPRHVPPRNASAVSTSPREPELVLVQVLLKLRKKLRQVTCCRL